MSTVDIRSRECWCHFRSVNSVESVLHQSDHRAFTFSTQTIADDPPVLQSNETGVFHTGGNSGSPIINGKGELIDVAFDGNWEAVVGVYLFQEPLNCCISVDSRYILFLLDKFSKAQSILNELVIKGSQGG